jgi:hypothetical protein
MTVTHHSLPHNLAAFSAQLRREHDFQIGPRELQDASRALLAVHLGDERVVRDVLRPVLCARAAEAEVFDRAFDAFFHSAAAVRLERGDTPSASDRAGRAESRGNPEVFQGLDMSDRPATADQVRRPHLPPTLDEASDDTATLLRSSYSPLDGEATAPAIAPASAPWRAAAAAFIGQLRLGLSRRWRPAHRGERFDLRRMLRHGLHTGGDAVTPRWQTRPRRRPRAVLLIDGSRSMSAHAQVALDMAVALTSVASRVETFTFSTTLHRVTREVRTAAAGATLELGRLHSAWGGGTTIGACLHDFVRHHGERLIGRDTVPIIASDGLDVGDARILREAMAALHRRSAGVVWLNPLLETPGYEPTAVGMSVARPYVSTLACVNDPAGLLRLAHVLRVRP